MMGYCSFRIRKSKLKTGFGSDSMESLWLGASKKNVAKPTQPLTAGAAGSSGSLHPAPPHSSPQD